MNTERTIDVSAVVTPNCAIESRNQISSHRTLQNPETKKNQKNHATHLPFRTRLRLDAKRLDARIEASYWLRMCSVLVAKKVASYAQNPSSRSRRRIARTGGREIIAGLTEHYTRPGVGGGAGEDPVAEIGTGAATPRLIAERGQYGVGDLVL